GPLVARSRSLRALYPTGGSPTMPGIDTAHGGDVHHPPHPHGGAPRLPGSDHARRTKLPVGRSRRLVLDRGHGAILGEADRGGEDRPGRATTARDPEPRRPRLVPH